MTKYLTQFALLCSLALAMLSAPSWADTPNTSDQTWHYVNAQGELKIKLYFFGRKPVHTAHKLTLLLIHYRKNIRG